MGIDASNLRAGGGVTHLTELLRSAEPGAHGVDEVVVWGGAATLKQLPERGWLRLAHEGLLDRALPFRVAWQACRLPSLARRGCDVLFSPGGAMQPDGMPRVVMCQNMLPFESAERARFGVSALGLKLRVLERSQGGAFHRADGVIFLTRYAREVVQRRIGRLHGAQAVIAHGIGSEFSVAPRPVKAAEWYSIERPFQIVYVSIIAPYKHQWRVAEAVAALRSSGCPVTLDLIGPSYSSTYRRLGEVLRRVDPDRRFIRYRGPVNHRDLVARYRDADAFVFASSCENLPIILLEAMASGLPIACSNRGPMPEVLGNAGIYFDPEDDVSIQAAVRSLLLDSQLRERCAWAAYERSKGFSWRKCANETFAFISRVVQWRRGG